MPDPTPDALVALTPERLEEIGRHHVPAFAEDGKSCANCFGDWPCHATQLVAALTLALEEVTTLRVRVTELEEEVETLEGDLYEACL